MKPQIRLGETSRRKVRIQTKLSCPGGRKGFNVFVAIELDNSEILGNMQQVQDHCVEKDASLAKQGGKEAEKAGTSKHEAKGSVKCECGNVSKVRIGNCPNAQWSQLGGDSVR